MLDTPCVSTPRRSVMVSTSAPSVASSGETPIFSKISATVRRREPSGILTWSGLGTLKRSSMDVSSWWYRGSVGEHALEHVAAEVAVLLECEPVEVAVVAEQRDVALVGGRMRP